MWRHKLALLIACAAAVWPIALSAQQPAMPVVGILNSTSVGLRDEQAAAFHAGLKEAGYVEGQNVAFEYRVANDEYDRLPGLAAELVNRGVAVIVAAGGPVSAIAARKVTATVPIVFTTIADPVKSGLVASLSRPGGNVTGTAGLTSELDPKRLELLHQLKPGTGPLGVLINPNRPDVDVQLRDVHSGAQAIGRQLIVLNTGTEREIDLAFETLARRPVDALLVSADPFFSSRRTQVLALTARHSVPAIYQWREFTMAGGLMSYGPTISDAYRQTGIYVGRILKGAQPADLPVTRPTRFEFVINRTTAKSLGLVLPRILLSRADDIVD
jgi:putative ABC transport system substrate-binding protein